MSNRNTCDICGAYMIDKPGFLNWLACFCGFAKKKPSETEEIKKIMFIKREEVLMGRDKEYPLTPELEANLTKLLTALNAFREKYGKPMIVSSGYRPGKYNTAAGGAKNSSHLTCEACDFKDSSKELKKWCVDNVKVLEECGLYMEKPERTPTWLHLQIRPTKNRIFEP